MTENRFTIEELIKKYDTNIDLNKMSNKLKKIILAPDGSLSLDNFKKPKHITHSNGTEEYDFEYALEDYTLHITYNPDDYRSMNIYVAYLPEGMGLVNYGWDYKGEPLIF